MIPFREARFAVVVFAGLMSVFCAGCWVAHTAHDRPELRAQIGKFGSLTGPAVLFRDRGGRLHLETGEVPSSATLVERLPAQGRIEVKNVVYRITEPGRSDYFVIEVVTTNGRFTVEVPVGSRSSPLWKYDEPG